MANMLFSNFIFIPFDRSSKTLMKVKSTLDSPANIRLSIKVSDRQSNLMWLMIIVYCIYLLLACFNPIMTLAGGLYVT